MLQNNKYNIKYLRLFISIYMLGVIDFCRCKYKLGYRIFVWTYLLKMWINWKVLNILSCLGYEHNEIDLFSLNRYKKTPRQLFVPGSFILIY